MRGYESQDNERLEFLGDAVLDYIVALEYYSNEAKYIGENAEDMKSSKEKNNSITKLDVGDLTAAKQVFIKPVGQCMAWLQIEMKNSNQKHRCNTEISSFCGFYPLTATTVAKCKFFLDEAFQVTILGYDVQQFVWIGSLQTFVRSSRAHR